MSGAILRLDPGLPELEAYKDYEIMGDEIRPLVKQPPIRVIVPDFEDIRDVLAFLPEVAVNHEQHLVKKGKYVSEAHNLLACQGGSCPGVPKSAHAIQLLGKFSNGELVFAKLFRVGIWRVCIPLRHT